MSPQKGALNQPRDATPSGIEYIAAERRRQVETEGWTPEHDDSHTSGELAWAAVAYAAPKPIFRMYPRAGQVTFADPWPWPNTSERGISDGDKRKSLKSTNYPSFEWTESQRVALLVKAGALIAAEIDRIQRKRFREKVGTAG